MDRTRRRAIAAGFSRAIAGLGPLLAEEDIDLVGRAGDGAEAMRLVRQFQPDVLVADAVLPGMDGIALVRQVRAMRLDVQPAVLLIRPQGLRLPGEAAVSGLCAGVLDAPLDAREFQEALARLDGARLTLPPDKAARLEELLNALGVPRHPGRDCLFRAIALAWADRRRLRSLKDGLYPELARQTGQSPAQAERAMRHAIDVAWRTGEIEQQHTIFGDTIDARRGKPTCGEMIAQLADILRWEG